jgi:hypothetical protein
VTFTFVCATFALFDGDVTGTSDKLELKLEMTLTASEGDK